MGSMVLHTHAWATLCNAGFSRYNLPYSSKFLRDLYFKNFVVQTKFVKYKTMKYFTKVLHLAKIHENCILELAN